MVQNGAKAVGGIRYLPVGSKPTARMGVLGADGEPDIKPLGQKKAALMKDAERKAKAEGKNKSTQQEIIGDGAEKYSGIKAPFIRTEKNMGSELLDISLDAKDTWNNGFFQNSRGLTFSFNNGKVEAVAKYGKLPKFRKTDAKTPEEAVKKINSYLEKNNLI